MAQSSRRRLILGVAALLFSALVPYGMAADDHSSHEGAHELGKGKGPKRGAGQRGSSHSDEVHDMSSHSHTSGKGGSKSLEAKVFHGDTGGRGKGPRFMGGKPEGHDESDHDEAAHDDGGSHEGGSHVQ